MMPDMPNRLRISVTALSLVSWIFLVALCVRSYYKADTLHWQISRGRTAVFSSVEGGLSVSPYIPIGLNSADRWELRTRTIGPARSWAEAPSWLLRKFRFGIVRHSTHITVCMPHCLVAMLIGSLAASLWLKNDCRFRLRALLIVMTLVAVGLGLGVTAM
jgi:hypothetical protein